jgi:peptide/nickel transport system ATP-binding protein
MALERCRAEPQTLLTVEPGHHVACWRWPETGEDRATSANPSLVPRPVSAAPLLSLEKVSIAYRTRPGIMGRWFPGKPVAAVTDLTIDVRRGETFALVGESGSGKSTVARAISGLLPPSSGRLLFENKLLEPLVRHRTSEQRRRIQYIFQNPDASLNPRARIGAILARPLQVYAGDADIPARIKKALFDVRLDSAYAARFPDELSGGERQRVAIARALIADPHLLICDEVLSALDVSVQASIIELLRALRRERDAAMLFISHDLAVVRSLADRIGVLFRGELMSVGATEAIFAPPYHPYTLSLLEAVPRIDAPNKPRPRPPAQPGIASVMPKCAYAGRCALQPGRICIDEDPPWQAAGSVEIRCHIPLQRLATLTVSPTNTRERKSIHENHGG